MARSTKEAEKELQRALALLDDAVLEMRAANVQPEKVGMLVRAQEIAYAVLHSLREPPVPLVPPQQPVAAELALNEVDKKIIREHDAKMGRVIKLEKKIDKFLERTTAK